MDSLGVDRVKRCRETLGKAMETLSDEAAISRDFHWLVENIAETVGALFRAERVTSEVELKASIGDAVGLLKRTLDRLQKLRVDDRTIEAVTRSLEQASQELSVLNRPRKKAARDLSESPSLDSPLQSEVYQQRPLAPVAFVNAPEIDRTATTANSMKTARPFEAASAFTGTDLLICPLHQIPYAAATGCLLCDAESQRNRTRPRRYYRIFVGASALVVLAIAPFILLKKGIDSPVDRIRLNDDQNRAGLLSAPSPEPAVTEDDGSLVYDPDKPARLEDYIQGTMPKGDEMNAIKAFDALRESAKAGDTSGYRARLESSLFSRLNNRTEEVISLMTLTTRMTDVEALARDGAVAIIQSPQYRSPTGALLSTTMKKEAGIWRAGRVRYVYPASLQIPNEVKPTFDDRFRTSPASSTCPPRDIAGRINWDAVVGGKSFVSSDRVYIKSIEALKGFASIISAVRCGELRKSIKIGPSRHLTDLFGFPQLKKIDGSLIITKNPRLENIHGLSSLREITGDMRLESLPRLSNLQGLKNITSVGSGKGTLRIQGCRALTDLSGLGGINKLDTLLLSDNLELQSLYGLSALKEATILVINRNHSLRNLDSLRGLQGVKTITIRANPMLQVGAVMRFIESLGPTKPERCTIEIEGRYLDC